MKNSSVLTGVSQVFRHVLRHAGLSGPRASFAASQRLKGQDVGIRVQQQSQHSSRSRMNLPRTLAELCCAEVVPTQSLSERASRWMKRLQRASGGVERSFRQRSSEPALPPHPRSWRASGYDEHPCRGVKTCSALCFADNRCAVTELHQCRARPRATEPMGGERLLMPNGETFVTFGVRRAHVPPLHAVPVTGLLQGWAQSADDSTVGTRSDEL